MNRLSAPLLAALVATASASVPPLAPLPSEHIEVRLAQIDVVVRDKNGAVVSGLGPKAFTVLDDGSPMEIVAVDEWGATRPSSPVVPPTTPSGEPVPNAQPVQIASATNEPERRSFVLVFDELGDSTALRVNQAKQAAANFFRAHLRPQDLAAVYQLDLTLRSLSGVTSNVDELAAAIGKITWMSASSLQDEIADSILSKNSSAFAPYMQQRLSKLSVNASDQLDWTREHVYDSLNSLASVFRGLPGRRVLVLASPGFPMTTAGDVKTGSGGFTPRFRDLIRSLAAYGITVYALDIGNDLAAGDASERIDWRVAVGELGLDENILSGLGLERSMGTGSASARREFLGVIAGESGGRLLTQTDLSKAFEAIQEESTHFYRISCRVPVTRGASRYRGLVVKVNIPGYSVASRRGRYSDIAPQENEASGALAAVDSLDRYKSIATRGIAIPLPGSDPKKVPVDVVIEAVGPIELPMDAQGGAALDVEFRIVARAEGEVVDRYERSFTARVKPDGVAAVRQAFRAEGRLSLVPGIYEVQGTLRLAEPPQLASWTSTIAVPPPPRGTVPTFVGVVLSGENASESPLLTRPQIADESDPLVLKPGARILPSTISDFQTGGSLLVLFWLRGIPDAGEKAPTLDLAINIVNGEGEVAQPPTKLLFFGKEPSGGYRAVARVDAATLTPGTYALRLTAAITGSDGPAARESVSFALHAKATESATSVSVGSP